MNPASAKARALAQKLDKARWHYATAFNSYTRYSWRPGTLTGRKDNARYEKHRARAEQLLAEVCAEMEAT